METKPKGIRNLGQKAYLRLSAQFTVDPGIFPEFIFIIEMNDLNVMTVTKSPLSLVL